MSLMDEVSELMIREMISGAIDAAGGKENVKQHLGMLDDLEEKLPDDQAIILVKIDDELKLMIAKTDSVELHKEPSVINLSKILAETKEDLEG